ncbi:hypothetical protein EGT74_11915 [Chitinophaga lutea]|uniref:Uncharacterized protein n=1 Tax=Chitinophaga lutea TaxID=2488634 RepID=A0A3N4Q3M6_9BACT|nr:hypothetical protein EGT74_11915 [Chitinophaga lutea]
MNLRRIRACAVFAVKAGAFIQVLFDELSFGQDNEMATAARWNHETFFRCMLSEFSFGRDNEMATAARWNYETFFRCMLSELAFGRDN